MILFYSYGKYDNALAIIANACPAAPVPTRTPALSVYANQKWVEIRSEIEL
jgi:hypothetical protein